MLPCIVCLSLSKAVVTLHESFHQEKFCLTIGVQIIFKTVKSWHLALSMANISYQLMCNTFMPSMLLVKITNLSCQPRAGGIKYQWSDFQFSANKTTLNKNKEIKNQPVQEVYPSETLCQQTWVVWCLFPTFFLSHLSHPQYYAKL